MATRGAAPAHEGASAATHATNAYCHNLICAGFTSQVREKAARQLPDGLGRVKRAPRRAPLERPEDREGGALALFGAHLDRAPVIGDDAMADHQAEPRALIGILRGEE